MNDTPFFWREVHTARQSIRDAASLTFTETRRSRARMFMDYVNGETMVVVLWCAGPAGSPATHYVEIGAPPVESPAPRPQ